MSLLDLSGRVKQLEELKLGVEKEAQDIQPPQWPENIDDEPKAGLTMEEREVLKMLENIGMLPGLIKGRILPLEGTDIININTPKFETFAVWDTPDKNDIISSEELLDLDNEVLITAIEDQCSGNLCTTLADLAAVASVDTDQDEADIDKEEDSPKHCSFFKEKKCKYLDKSFKPPHNTHWISCSYPNFQLWYHEQCLSLQFTTDKERHDYTLICSKHNNIREHFRTKLAALASDEHSLFDENIFLKPLPKHLWVSKKTNSPKHQTDHSLHPNYVEHEGQYYHIAEFLSLQEGKVYHPATSTPKT